MSRPESPESNDGFTAVGPRIWWLVFIIGSLLAFPFALNLALGNSLGRDEHQHLAAGFVILREGWLPYRDFAFFHLPYLPWTYAGLFSLGGDPLLISRLFSALCVALMAGLTGAAVWEIWREQGERAGRAGLSALVAMTILMTIPLFADEGGHSWNLEPSTLCLLAAFVALLSGRGGAVRWIAAGVLTGLAAGYRITVLPMVLPLMMMAGWQGRRAWFFFTGGLSVGMLPVLAALLSAPVGFLFGNLEFPSLAVDYRYHIGEVNRMTLISKLGYFFGEVVRRNWPLMAGLPLLLAVLWKQGRLRGDLKLRWVLLAVPFLLMGALAPSPSYAQYYYPLMPFLVIALMAALRRFPAWLQGGAIALFAIFALVRLDEYTTFRRLATPSEWIMAEAYQEAEVLRSRIDSGARVLTVVPVLPLEAGMKIYPEFVTGPFAWRISPLVGAGRYGDLHLADPGRLAAILEEEPPAAILTGYASRAEEPIVAYARAHGYRKERFPGGKSLWLPDKR